MAVMLKVLFMVMKLKLPNKHNQNGEHFLPMKYACYVMEKDEKLHGTVVSFDLFL